MVVLGQFKFKFKLSHGKTQEKKMSMFNLYSTLCNVAEKSHYENLTFFSKSQCRCCLGCSSCSSYKRITKPRARKHFQWPKVVSEAISPPTKLEYIWFIKVVLDFSFCSVCVCVCRVCKRCVEDV